MKRRLLLATLLIWSTALAQTDEEIFKEVGIVCTGTLAMAAELTDVKLSKMVMQSDAKWWRDLLVDVYGESDVDPQIADAMRSVKDSWNGNKISWDELLDICQQCSEMKIQLETTNE